jgi:hypothetical protein
MHGSDLVSLRCRSRQGDRAMHTQTIVAQVMQCCFPLMHAARWRTLHDVVVSSVSGHALGLVALAVGTPRTTKVRHRVKCADRLLGNNHLKAHRFDRYAALARRWLTELPQRLIVVDCPSLTADMQWHWLRASIVCDGRSITLYEEVHPSCCENSRIRGHAGMSCEVR